MDEMDFLSIFLFQKKIKKHLSDSKIIPTFVEINNMATHKHVMIVHPKFGEVLNETFMDEVQFKIFLNMVHSSIELNQNLSTFNGKDFLVHIPSSILKESLVIGKSTEVSLSEVVMAKSKLEG
jgi:hypothetical protein